MRRVDVCVVAAVFIIVAAVASFLILAVGPAAAAFVLGLALLFGVFVVASFCSNHYGHREQRRDQVESHGEDM